MFYLNTVTDDGGTYFSNYDLTLDAVEGRLVIWPAYWTHFHKGIVSASQEKYIATGWYEKIESSTVIRKVKKNYDFHTRRGLSKDYENDASFLW